jgi:hypothetical protein|uniref:Uncharacterized protein n=1 Tax=Wolbachia endosymbiont of Aleurodicus floccissimus TaxID=2152762 RepID=A0A3B0IXM3_9RICK
MKQEGLYEINKSKPLLANRVPKDTEEAVVSRVSSIWTRKSS